MTGKAMSITRSEQSLIELLNSILAETASEKKKAFDHWENVVEHMSASGATDEDRVQRMASLVFGAAKLLAAAGEYTDRQIQVAKILKDVIAPKEGGAGSAVDDMRQMVLDLFDELQVRKEPPQEEKPISGDLF